MDPQKKPGSENLATGFSPITRETGQISTARKILGLRPNVFWLGLVSLINDFSSEMVYSVMPAFLTIALGAPPVFIGFIEGFADALASILKIYFGWFSDKIGKRKILAVSGYALATVTRWFLALVTSFWQVFIWRAIDRVGKGLRDSPRDALLSESVDSQERGKSFGYHRAMDTIGGTLGPLLAIFLLPIIAYDYRLLFKIGFIVGILSVLTFVFVKDVKIKRESTEPFLPFRFAFRNFSREFKMYILSVFIFGLGFMPIPLMLLESLSLGISWLSIPFLYFVYSLSFVIFAIPAGRLADKIGEKKILALGFLMAVIAYTNLFLFSAIISLILGFVILGLYSAMTDGVERALVAKLVPAVRLATGQGFLNAAVGFSSFIAGIVGGGLWTKFGSNQAFLYGIIMMVIGLLTFIYLNGHRKDL